MKQEQTLIENSGKSFIAGVGNSVERSLRSCCLRNPELELIAAEKGKYQRLSER